jgi:hypothetical protein
VAVKLEISAEAYKKLKFLAQVAGKSEERIIEELLTEKEVKVRELMGKRLDALKELKELSDEFKGLFGKKSFQEIKSELHGD